MTNDKSDLYELRNAIRKLYMEINSMYEEVKLIAPTNLNEMGSLQLAMIYHDLRNMLP